MLLESIKFESFAVNFMPPLAGSETRARRHQAAQAASGRGGRGGRRRATLSSQTRSRRWSAFTKRPTPDALTSHRVRARRPHEALSRMPSGADSPAGAQHFSMIANAHQIVYTSQVLGYPRGFQGRGARMGRAWGYRFDIHARAPPAFAQSPHSGRGSRRASALPAPRRPFSPHGCRPASPGLRTACSTQSIRSDEGR